MYRRAYELYKVKKPKVKRPKRISKRAAVLAEIAASTELKSKTFPVALYVLDEEEMLRILMKLHGK